MDVNVYKVMDHPNAEEQFVKAKIVSQVADIIRNLGLTQAQVAERAGLTQPQVSNILKGRFRDISIEKLLTIATSLNHAVYIKIDSQPSESACIYVEEAIAA